MNTAARPYSLEFGLCSDIGRVRTRNEDACHADAQRGFAVLADGMGGYRGGDVAAALAVAATRRMYENHAGPWDAEMAAQLAFDATLEANLDIYRGGMTNASLAGMGSTLVMAIFLGDEVLSAHVGDSRLYRLRGEVLDLLTRDHTMLQDQVDAGLIGAEEARTLGYRGLLTRGLGVSEDVVPDLGLHTAAPGDVFLLCSDGLTDMVDEYHIAHILGADAPSQAMAEGLVLEANRLGGRDNVSAIVARLVV